LDFTVKVQLEILPPDTGHVKVGTLVRSPSGLGPAVLVNVTKVSVELNPDPVTVTTVPVVPTFGEKMTSGPPVTVKVADARGATASFTFTR
jgi:hypothetical protein